MSNENKKRPGLLGGGPVSFSGKSSRLDLSENSLQSDFSMSAQALQIGGRLRSVVDLSTGEVLPTPGAGVSARAAGGGLSTAHISPDVLKRLPVVEWYAGASVLRVSRGGTGERVGGGKRGSVSGFSFASRRRLLHLIGRVRRDAALPVFVTLTYPKIFPTARDSKRHIDIFSKRFSRRFPDSGYIWKLEPQERGAPHYHLLVWGVSVVDLRAFVPFAWYQIAGGGDKYHLDWHLGLLGRGNTHCVQAVKSFRGVWAYASKYLAKTFDVPGWQDVGRFWGVVGRDCIPFGEHLLQVVSRAVAVNAMRMQRRFARIKRTKGFSTTIFCDSQQWVNRLL